MGLLQLPRNNSYVFDPQGNMAQRLDWQGNILSSSTYDAYGLQSSIDTSGDPYNGFGAQWGYYKDTETGLSLLGLRYYDPGTGRFLTRDPIGYAGGENLYRYCHNNPLSGIDPTGTYDQSSDNIVDDGSDVVSNRETSTAGMFSGRDPAFQQAGLDTAGLLLRSVPGVGPVYAGISAATGCDALTLRSESNSERGWDGVQAVAAAIPLLDGLSAIRFPAWLCPGGCFVAGTPVQMADGTTKPIEEIKEGDTVATRDPSTGKTETKQVVRTFKHPAHETITVQLTDSQTGEVVDTLTATPEHPFFVPGQGAIPLGQLGIGTQVVTRSGPALVIASLVKHAHPQGVSVYNFEVEDDHTYFVGTASGGAWVHNIYA